MIAFKTYAQCPVEQRPPGVNVGVPWQQQRILKADAEKYLSLGWQVREEYAEDGSVIVAGKSPLEVVRFNPTDEADYPFSWAVDMGPGPDFRLPIFGTDWVKLAGFHKLWDYGESLNEDGSVFEIKKTGVYSWDAQVRLVELDLVDAVELAIFKVEDPQDDFWFIMSRRDIAPGQTVVQLSGNTQFDFRAGEKYYLAVRLLGVSPRANLSGDDDYTAWGANWDLPLIQGGA